MQTFSLKKCTFFNLDNTFSPIFGIQNHYFVTHHLFTYILTCNINSQLPQPER